MKYEVIAKAIDFEGYIDIKKRINKNKISIYSYNIGRYNTSQEFLEDFKNKVKFGIIKNYKNLYHWNMNKEEIKIHLPLILPYLHLKWRQAELVLEVLSILKTRKISKQELYAWDEYMILELCYQECKILNKKGRQ